MVVCFSIFFFATYIFTPEKKPEVALRPVFSIAYYPFHHCLQMLSMG